MLNHCKDKDVSRKFIILILLPLYLLLSSCFMSPMYQMQSSRRIDFYDPDMPEAAKRGWSDGCKSGLIHDANPSSIKYMNNYYMDPYYMNDPVYRDAWSATSHLCALKYGYLRNKSYLGVYNYLAPRGDSVQFKK
jgi:hypothetical protein